MKTVLTLLGLLLAGNGWAGESLSAKHPWVREAPPGVNMLAGYVVLSNDGEQRQVLTGASSASFRSVSIHRSYVEDGVSRMRPAGELTIEAGETLSLEPGGLHLMLMGPEAPLRAGDEVEIRLEFAGREALPLRFVVERR